MIFAANARKPWHQAEIGLKYDIAKELVGSCVRRHQRALLAMHEADIKRVGSMKFAGCDDLWTRESNLLKKKVYNQRSMRTTTICPVPAFSLGSTAAKW
jgi:hypothetical protein